MEKLSLTVGFKDGKPTILAYGKASECHEVYKANTHNTDYDFVGYLRNPTWTKRIGAAGAVRREARNARALKEQEAALTKSQADTLEAQAKAAAAAAEAALAAASTLREQESAALSEIKAMKAKEPAPKESPKEESPKAELQKETPAKKAPSKKTAK
jgi:hypothetical protein